MVSLYALPKIRSIFPTTLLRSGGFFDKEVFGSPLAQHMRVAYGAKAARRCVVEGWTTYDSNRTPRTFKMVLDILTGASLFYLFPHEGRNTFEYHR